MKEEILLIQLIRNLNSEKREKEKKRVFERQRFVRESGECTCVCVCERERERERGEFTCVCEREKERERGEFTYV